jgi:hypothetical protein
MIHRFIEHVLYRGHRRLNNSTLMYISHFLNNRWFMPKKSVRGAVELLAADYQDVYLENEGHKEVIENLEQEISHLRDKLAKEETLKLAWRTSYANARKRVQSLSEALDNYVRVLDDNDNEIAREELTEAEEEYDGKPF